MKIVIAPDSFKESLTALEVAKAIQTGFSRIFPNADYELVPMADGGEGSVQSLIDATNGNLQKISVKSPLVNQVEAFFGLSGDKKTAFIEMAAASGLHLVPNEQRNPLITTSYGTGELIKAALNCGVEKILLGIGGSATNDGGVGMLQALGVKFLNAKKQEIDFGGEALSQIQQIDLSGLDKRLSQVAFEVACDVDNPLCGEQGASAIFGPQKGATPEMVETLDNALRHFAEQAQTQLGVEIADKAGAGAAGGMGGGLLLLPNVTLRSGVNIIIETTHLAEKIADADLVITGEGRMDAQSIAGKTPIGVAKIAKQFNKPVIAIAGSLREDYPVVYQHGIDAVFPIIRQLNSLEETLKLGKENLISASENVARVWKMATAK
ncbi:glycerate kinase [Mannheimia sp. ZY171111]|uniref:glycerate kinase n=1 Tax=Mannheimia sp. ZY171111 TaxID=2679995 RepID=UPI001ADDD50F|nr:glycerate kinase [Mannheimia sp. ZY171111]QTM02011.1 glycerate kinase [Mannheimia sp. ZY171111]